jgi:hypothetical protein
MLQGKEFLKFIKAVVICVCALLGMNILHFKIKKKI